MSAQKLYDLLVRHQDSDADDLSADARPHIAGNGLRQMAAQALQSAGDEVVNAKTVLPWLMNALGAPGAFVAFLVPIRESGSMLPQAAWAPRVQARRQRKWVWVAGAAGQAVATAAMALVAATAEGWVAGIGILVALAVFAVARSLSSIASKDVLGRTVSQGQRGQIQGVTTVASAIVAVTLGLGLRFWGGDLGVGVLAALLGGAAVLWALGALIYATIREPSEEGEASKPREATQASATGDSPPDDDGPGWVSQAAGLWRDDGVFRRFVVARGLLLVSALSPPFVVALSLQGDGEGLSSLGLFILAQGVAGIIGGRVFGRLADASSRRLMIGASIAASATIVMFLGLRALPGVGEAAWLPAAAYFVLALVHLGVRLARKTYVVDIAEGDQRTEYVAVANTLMGVLLLAVGVVTAGLAVFGNAVALVALAVLGVVGAWVGRGLPEAEKG
ncbi:MFS transporter [Demequina sp. NBRC 110057]|uniref:MFS transporter n=1 Tax=Demequina sp. NBRC 110057 TaxID=1570346 RepID=UPI0009FDD8DC|nr:MFS transporter [Demequina sp. NBRC 110057]